MAQLFYLPNQPVQDTNNLPLAGALLTFFVSQTTTLAPIYEDAGLTTLFPNPVEADAFGRIPSIYLDNAVNYRLRITRPNGSPLGPDIDPYVPTSDAQGGGQIAP